MNAPLKPAHSPFGGSVASRVLRCPASVGLLEKVPALDPGLVDDCAVWFESWESGYRGAGVVGERVTTVTDADDRAAHLLAWVGLGAYLVVFGVMVARLFVGSGGRDQRRRFRRQRHHE